jgi:hypothetical protein
MVAIYSTWATSGKDTHILLYCDQQSSKLYKKILPKEILTDLILWISPEQKNSALSEACWARYEIFRNQNLSNYQSILYLDTDIIVSNSLRNLFGNFLKNGKMPISLHNENKKVISANNESIYHGESYFKHFKNIATYEGSPAMTTGVMLFWNCQTIKTIFEASHMLSLKFWDESMHSGINVDLFNQSDQPAINYLLTTNRLADTSLLSELVANNPSLTLETAPLISHFPGVVGNANKVQKMIAFIEAYKNSSEHVAETSLFVQALSQEAYFASI